MLGRQKKNSNMNRKVRRRSAGLVALSGLATCLMAGCAWSVGGNKGETVVRPTRGQELVDLKKALDQGAITEEEYKGQRKRILER